MQRTPSRTLRHILPAALAGLLLSFATPAAQANDQIYPPAASAKATIDFDSRSFLINGNRTYLTSGSLHYPRLPRAEWPDILERMARGSFTSVETYAFWNYHEPREGEVDFTGEKDLGAFLDMAQQAGLYATVRVGPYVCAEWDFGGYPIWIKFKPNVVVRTDTPGFLALNDHWYGEVFPVIAPHQINKGGNVILVQLENEHPKGWGVVTDDPYFVKVRAQALKYGLEVPHWMSGLNHSHNPRPENLSGTGRPSPWYSTEFWCGWFDSYRTLSDKRYAEIDETIWTILAHGGSGYNDYMLFGGTDFETWNNNEVGASYDYGAAIGQAGDLRPMYYRMKRENQLPLSFEEILGGSTDALPGFRGYATGPGLQVLGARRSDAGTLVFLQNTSNVETAATFQGGETLKVPAHTVYPFAVGAKIAEGVTATTTLPVLAAARHDGMATLVVYGKPGETGRVTLDAEGGLQGGADSSAIAAKTDGGKTDLRVTIPDRSVAEWEGKSASGSVRVLALSEALSLRTWIVGEKEKRDLVVGPAYVGAFQEAEGKVSFHAERPYGQPSCGQAAVYGGPGQEWHLAVPAHPEADALPAPELSEWKTSPLMEADPTYDDSAWKQSENPLQMGADGDIDAYAWYRAAVDVPVPGPGLVRLTGHDAFEVYVNGKPAPVHDGAAHADFTMGKNTIAVFAWHNGRDKAVGYIGPVADYDDKGVTGPVTVEVGESKLAVIGWRMRGGLAPSLAQAKWDGKATPGLPSFFRATFVLHSPAPGMPGPHPVLRVGFAGLKRGTMWVNGHNLGQYPEKIPVNGLYIPESWLKDGENELTACDVAGTAPAQVKLSVEKEASREVVAVDAPVDPATPIVVP